MNLVTKVYALALVLLVSLAAQAEEKSRHHDFPVAVAGFHDVMAPLWHAPSGEQRDQKICEQHPNLVAHLGKIRAAKIPKNVVSSDEWQNAIENLSEGLTSVKHMCASGRTPEYSFAIVHEGFHELVSLIGHKH